jgi:hypothetical protein
MKARTNHTSKLDQLVSRVQGGSLEAGAELFRFVMQTAEPYLQSTVGVEDVESDLEDVVSVTWDAIRNGALLKPEYLPAFVETLIWQQVRRHVHPQKAAAPGFIVITGGRTPGRKSPPDPLLAPQT